MFAKRGFSPGVALFDLLRFFFVTINGTAALTINDSYRTNSACSVQLIISIYGHFRYLRRLWDVTGAITNSNKQTKEFGTEKKIGKFSYFGIYAKAIWTD